MIDLDRPKLPAAKTAAAAMKDAGVLRELLDGISPETKKAARRENCSQAVLHLVQRNPKVLLPHWPYFVKLLRSGNGFSQYVAVYAVAAMAEVERKGWTAKALGAFLSGLDGSSLMVAGHTIANAGRIAKAQPALQNRIAARLTALDRAPFDAGRRELLKGYAIEAFDGFCDECPSRSKILAFVQAQADSRNAKTKKLAKDFLRRRGIAT